MFWKAPKGFREPPRRVSDIRHGDLARLRERLKGDGSPLTEFNMARREVDIEVPRKRKGKQSTNFVVYRRTGCMTKERVAAVSAAELKDLVLEFGYCRVWDVMDRPIIVSRAVWYRNREWRAPPW